MAYQVVPFVYSHVQSLAEADVAEGLNPMEEITPEVGRLLERTNSWTLLGHEGEVLACSGTMEQWPGRHSAWLYTRMKFPRGAITPMVRRIRQELDALDGRVEMTVRRGFGQGLRLARLLGFEIENPPGILKQYDPDGSDHIALVRFS